MAKVDRFLKRVARAEEKRLFFTSENFNWLESKVIEALGIEKLHQRPIENTQKMTQ